MNALPALKSHDPDYPLERFEKAIGVLQEKGCSKIGIVGASTTGIIFTIYKLYDMVCFDYFLLIKSKFFQYYFPEVESVFEGRIYGFNIKSQLLKLLVIFPAASALAAWICTLFQ